MGVQDILDLREEVGENKIYRFKIHTEDGEYSGELDSSDFFEAVHKLKFEFKNKNPFLKVFNIVYMYDTSLYKGYT